MDVGVHGPVSVQQKLNTAEWRSAGLTILVLAILFSVSACTSQRVSSHTKGTVRFSLPPPGTEGLSLAAPTVGLFVGVSEYGERATVWSTPAHALSAALMYEPFFDAATRSDMRLRKKALGIPDNNYAKSNSDAGCATAYSPDGSQVITVSEDGSAVIRRIYGTEQPLSLPSIAGFHMPESHACSVAFSSDGSRIAIGVGRSVAIWARSSNGIYGIPIVLSYPSSTTKAVFGHDIADVKFSHEGSRLLTASFDGVTRIYRVSGDGRPLEFSAEKGCEGVPKAEFSPKSQTVAIASCSKVRVESADDPDHGIRLGRQSSLVFSLAFSPDGTQIVTAGADGTRIWSSTGAVAPLLIPVPKGPVKAAVKVVFSPDQSLLAIGYDTGFVQILPANQRGSPVMLPSNGGRIRSLQFSPDSKYVLATSDTGSAWVQDVTGRSRRVFVPRPNAPRSKWDDIRTHDALRKGDLPPKPTPLGIRTSVFSADASRIFAVYDDGTTAIHPGPLSQESPGFRVDDLTLLADLKATYDDPDSKLALQYLLNLNGVARQMGHLLPDTYFVGRGEPVTRQRILDSLSRALLNAKRVLEHRHGVVFVAYVSAHGWMGPDGHPYLLPADADADDPKTWISYEEFLQPIYAFLAQKTNDRSIVGSVGEDTTKLAIVIFDTCQTSRETTDNHPPPLDLSRNGLIVVHSTSPGRYAWQWMARMESQTDIAIEKETRWGFPLPPKAPRGLTSSRLEAGMSVLPLASQIVLNHFIEAKRSVAEDVGRMISADDWISGMRDGVQDLLKEIPEVGRVAKMRDQGGAPQQQVLDQFDPHQYDFWLFDVDATSEP